MIPRRKALSICAQGILGAPYILSRRSLLHAAGPASPAVVVHNPDLSTFTPFVVNASEVQETIDSMIMTLSGKPAVGAAWESLFPEGRLDASTKIGIKVNLAFTNKGKPSPAGVQAVVTDAIVGGLTRMLDGTFPVENITIFDRWLKYMINAKQPQAQGFPPFNGKPYDDKKAGRYRLRLIDVNSAKEIPSAAPGFNGGTGSWNVPNKILPPVYESDFLINVGVPKNHENVGYTGMLKNTFGCASNCMQAHDKGDSGVNLCIPNFFRATGNQAPFVLHVMDALGGMYTNGPVRGPAFHSNILMMSRDPMTIEYHGLDLLNRARKEQGINAVTTKKAVYLDRSAKAPYSFGNFNKGILLDVEQSSGSGKTRAMPALQVPQARLLNLHCVTGGWRLDVLMDASNRARRLESTITDIDGRLIRSFGSVLTRSIRHSLSWDGSDDRRRRVAPGIYGWLVRVDARLYTRTVFVN